MNRGAVVVDDAELVEWFDVLDELVEWRPVDVEKLLQLARKCQHPDARWLAALFAPGTHVMPEGMREVMLQQGDDPRALYFASQLVVGDRELLRRAADKGYARAQVDLAARTEDDAEKLQLLEKACEQNDREGLYELGSLCKELDDVKRATELFRRAAELNHHGAQFEYGGLAFGPLDWERFHWLAKAAEGGVGEAQLCRDVGALLADFERGECGRILSTAAPVIRQNLAVWRTGHFFSSLLGCRDVKVEDLERVFELHAAMLRRARRAVDCWSMAGRRCRVLKDMRVMIAKMLWAEAWCWGDKENVEHE
jgi:tetratricopeptide (TPR) repeat protein